MATRRDLPGKRVLMETSVYTPSVGVLFVSEARRRLSDCHERIQHCVNQLDDERLWWRPDESMNSIANLILHLCGNLQQWIVGGVGGAADTRNRPQEFAERGPIARAELLRRLDTVVADADAALVRADDAKLAENCRIQGFDGTVLGAIFDSLTHLGGHTQEIIHLTRVQLGRAYRFAWVPTTPEQKAATGPKESETAAARDALFGGMTTHPLDGGASQPGEIIEMPPLERPLDDYLLKLEQEFQDDESRGKL